MIGLNCRGRTHSIGFNVLLLEKTEDLKWVKAVFILQVDT